MKFCPVGAGKDRTTPEKFEEVFSRVRVCVSKSANSALVVCVVTPLIGYKQGVVSLPAPMATSMGVGVFEDAEGGIDFRDRCRSTDATTMETMARTHAAIIMPTRTQPGCGGTCIPLHFCYYTRKSNAKIIGWTGCFLFSFFLCAAAQMN